MIGLGTYMGRFSIIGLSSRIKFSDRVKQIFSFIPAAVLPALIAPMAFYHQGQVEWLMNKERLVILALATAVCYFTKSMLGTILFGLISLYLVSHL